MKTGEWIAFSLLIGMVICHSAIWVRIWREHRMAVATAQYAATKIPTCPKCKLRWYEADGSILKCINGHEWTHPDISAVECFIFPPGTKPETIENGKKIMAAECCKKKDEVIKGLAERTAAQSEILSRRSEKKQATSAERKTMPIGTGVLDYFPDALLAVANCSYIGNEQHNPGMPLHWDRSKSTDEADAMIRHFLDRGTVDEDGVRHSAKMAWRALAILQKEIENESANS